LSSNSRIIQVKILDFGLAKLIQPQLTEEDAATVSLHEQTRPGQVLGTVGYMAPEQVRGLPVDTRSDIFAFGAVLYEMLCGNRAFSRDNFADILSAILHTDPPVRYDASSDIPPVLARVIRRCLEKSPEQRFHSAHDLGCALEAAAAAPNSTPGIDSDSVEAVARQGKAPPAPVAELHTPKEVPRSEPGPATKAVRPKQVVAIGLILVVALGGLYLFLRPRTPVVTGIHQLTRSGRQKTVGSGWGQIVDTETDGTRVYFQERDEGKWRIAQVSTKGGDVS
jgi:serine/threonine protein kinase